MSKGINKVILVGNVGSDPEIRYTSSNLAVANFSLATSDSWKDKNTGERKESTEWHRLVVFGRLAEIVRDYTRKGTQIYGEGRLQTRKWQDRDGNDRYTTEVVINEIALLGGRNADAPPRDKHQESGTQGARPDSGNGGGHRRNPTPPPQSSKPSSPSSPSDNSGDDFEDDIPF